MDQESSGSALLEARWWFVVKRCCVAVGDLIRLSFADGNTEVKSSNILRHLRFCLTLYTRQEGNATSSLQLKFDRRLSVNKSLQR